MLRSEVFCDKNAEDLTKLNQDDAALRKGRQITGLDTESHGRVGPCREENVQPLGSAILLHYLEGTAPEAPFDKIIMHARFLALKV